jgi:hypothetical protein
VAQFLAWNTAADFVSNTNWQNYRGPWWPSTTVRSARHSSEVHIVADSDRAQQLTQRYRDLPLGFADAAVIACAERNGGRVLTIDRRHFPVVARGEKTITVLPHLQE